MYLAAGMVPIGVVPAAAPMKNLKGSFKFSPF
jgi:hypothetical protein